MTPNQTQELHRAIEQRRTALVAELREDMRRLRSDRHQEVASPAGDPGDESVALLIADLDRAEAGRDVDELRSLEAARARLADGSYGTCVECGREIGFERLRANPTAVRCIDCQTAYEKTHASNAGSSL